jgi:hypothetical protein
MGVRMIALLFFVSGVRSRWSEARLSPPGWT